MKETRRQGTQKIHSLWTNLTSGIKDKVNKNNSENKKEELRDMSETHTPISRLDLTGMNRTQAKEMIGKIIDERLEEISHIELTELKIDHKERERERAKAAERINERRNRRKQHAGESQTIITEQGIYSNFKQPSIFDEVETEAIQADEQAAEPIEGQLSILDAIAAVPNQTVEVATTIVVNQADEFAAAEIADTVDAVETEDIVDAAEPAVIIDAAETVSSTETFKTVELPETEDFDETEQTGMEKLFHTEFADEIAQPEKSEEAASEEDAYRSAGFDFFGLLQYDPDREGLTEEEADRLAGIQISTAIDETVDKVFTFFNKNKEKLLRLCGKVHGKASLLMREKIQPAAAMIISVISRKLRPLLQTAENRLHLKDKTAVVSAALARGEKKTAGVMIRFVDSLDRKNEAIIHFLVVVKEKICHRADLIRDYAEHHKKKLLIEFGAVVAVAAMITIIIGNMTAYEYIYNGKILGVVKNQEDVYKTIDIIGDKLSAQYDADITIDKDKDIRFKKVIAFKQDIDDKDDILNRLTYMRDMKATGRGIYIEGKLVAVLESDKTARGILQDIENKYVKNDANIQYKKIGFAEKVEIKDVETKLGSIQSKDKALEYLMTGAVEKKIHVVQSGETFSEIAKMYGMKQSELKVSNPEVIPEKLQIGQEICLNQIVPLVTVQTTEVAQYKQVIPFEVKYENTANLYKNEQTVKSKGSNGEKDVVAEIVRNNGIEVSRNELSSTIITQPVAQVVMIGTKEPPPLIGTGSFIYPVRGRLSSNFGYRWGRLHSGIDLAAPIGTYIKAADGGKVTFAGYNGSLGYMVAIDHGGGRVTWYGHCSKLFVKKGDKVYQGQHIANVGNTGRSTGPHCHFEVHINGVAKNPLKYL